jgi:hypothetical protein
VAATPPAEEAQPKRKGINPILVGLFFLFGGAGAAYAYGLRHLMEHKPLSQSDMVLAFAGMIALVIGIFIRPIALIVQLLRFLTRRTDRALS